MSNTYTNLPNLSIGNNGADVIIISSSSITVTSVNTPVGAATASATITALPSSKSFYRMAATLAVSLRGITAGVDGQRLDLYFKAATTQALTITPSATAAAAAARILLMTTAATAATTGSGFLSFIYSSDDSRWLLKYIST